MRRCNHGRTQRESFKGAEKFTPIGALEVVFAEHWKMPALSKDEVGASRMQVLRILRRTASGESGREKAEQELIFLYP